MAPKPLLPRQAKAVSREEVARFYINTELRNIVSQPVSQKELHGTDLWRVLEALSFTFRANGIFTFVSDEMYDWYEAKLPATAITLTSMSESANKVVYSPEVARDPAKMVAYLRAYFAKHPHDDPEHLNELRPRPVPLALRTIIVRQKDTNLHIADGSHRFLSLLASDKPTVNAYVGVLSGKPSRPMVGAALPHRLKLMFEHTTDPADKKAILRVMRLLLDIHSDASEAVQKYWIGYARNKDSEKAGCGLLAGLQDLSKT